MFRTSDFHSKHFEINGITIPQFDLKSGKLIRFYVPSVLTIGFDLTLELIKHFQDKNKNLPWAKHYSEYSIWERIFPLTVKRYLVKKHKINLLKAQRIADEVGINLNDNFGEIGHINRRTIIMKAYFENYDFILIDYYGVDAIGIVKLENILNSEIEKGKKAIAFDSLQYMEEKEPFNNIERIVIKEPENYKFFK